MRMPRAVAGIGLALCLAAPDARAEGAAPIRLECQGEVAMPGAAMPETAIPETAIPEARLDALCDALAAALGAAAPDRAVLRGPHEAHGPGLHVTLFVTRLDARRIEAHLGWRAGTGQMTRGQRVTLSVEDRPALPARSRDMLARSLLRATDLPL